ncbi:MAG: sigma 54-interacting transcriptional regulator [Candidatus Hydrogenedentes bacterium]|nr:sigma 54-interacting transcriptional regulator [Candidatus Hydrogenedentota bacterium]
MSVDYVLQIASGTNVGKTWRLDREPAVIGRSAECTIRIVDSTISRRHCEVWVDDDGPHIKDLGSSNDTLVNGAPVSETLLRDGDEIQLGAYSLRMVEVNQTTPMPEGNASDVSTPATVALSEGFFIQDAPEKNHTQSATPQLSQFRGLLHSHREFARCTNVADLIASLSRILDQRFQPEAWWLVRVLGPDRKPVPHPLSTATSADTLPAGDIQKALASKCGFLMPRRRMLGGKPSIETTIIAPLIVADDQIGALALRAGTPHRVYDESDLEYFLGLAHSFAPYLCAAEQMEQLRRDMERLRRQGAADTSLIGDSAAMKKVRELVGRAGKMDLPVLLLGETGTGKEAAARMVHDLSGRANRPYVIVNAAAIPRELFESEMFGYEKGAFTGATRQKVGYFEEAHTGTLFLDEIGDLAVEHQARILRVIESGKFNRVGGTREIGVDVRIVSATNRELAGKEHAQEFRQDLYHRLSGFVISMPPLRDRKSDIPALVEHFLRRAQPAGPGGKLTVAPSVLEKLATYSWPGNVRELRSCVERAVALAQTDVIEPEDVMLPTEGKRDPDSSSHLLTLADAEKHHIQRILKRHKGNIRSAAQALKISRVTLYKKINDYGIDV